MNECAHPNTLRPLLNVSFVSEEDVEFNVVSIDSPISVLPDHSTYDCQKT